MIPVSSDPCPAMTFEESATIAGGATDRFVWHDATCRPRSAAMARVGGGYVRQFTYEYDDGQTRTATGTGANGHNGWGYPVNHELGSFIAQDGPGEFGPVFVGRHHAIYEYRLVFPDTDVRVTLSWFFATGRNNPVLAITYDLSNVPADQYTADSRTPYGDIAWDGDENRQNTVVSGVGWGDRYKFITTEAPLTMNSAWDYAEPNLVPYCVEWADASDAEMGAVQTQTYVQHDAGGYWFYENWGRTSSDQVPADGQAGAMPVTWNWPYQLNQYELCIDDPACLDATTSSHRLAWGSNYGAVGSANYPALGDDRQLSGHPYQSYSVFMVLGKHGDAPVFAQVAEIETVQRTRLTASVGSVPTQGRGGVGREDLVDLDPAGYDHGYSVWMVDAADNAVDLGVDVEAGALQNPVLVVRGYTNAAEPTVSVDGAILTADDHFLASHDPEREALYLTFRGGWSGAHTISIR
jgi:hypothetical protein